MPPLSVDLEAVVPYLANLEDLVAHAASRNDDRRRRLPGRRECPRDWWSEDVTGRQVVNRGPPKSIHVENAYWSVAPVVGVSSGYGRVSVSARHYFIKANSQNRNVPPLCNDVTTVELKVKI